MIPRYAAYMGSTLTGLQLTQAADLGIVGLGDLGYIIPCASVPVPVHLIYCLCSVPYARLKIDGYGQTWTLERETL